MSSVTGLLTRKNYLEISFQSIVECIPETSLWNFLLFTLYDCLAYYSLLHQNVLTQCALET